MNSFIIVSIEVLKTKKEITTPAKRETLQTCCNREINLPNTKESDKNYLICIFKIFNIFFIFRTKKIKWLEIAEKYSPKIPKINEIKLRKQEDLFLIQTRF